MRGDLARVPGAQIALNILEGRMVEQAEELKANLEIEPLGGGFEESLSSWIEAIHSGSLTCTQGQPNMSGHRNSSPTLERIVSHY